MRCCRVSQPPMSRGNNEGRTRISWRLIQERLRPAAGLGRVGCQELRRLLERLSPFGRIGIKSYT